MRRLAVLFGLGLLLLACTPSPAKVCAHFDELDKTDPMPQYGVAPKRQRPSKLTACQKTLFDLQQVDANAYSVAAKCITKATTSKDAWNCWVLDHISDTKQPEKKKNLLACDQACNEGKDQCEPRCSGNNDCLGGCHSRYEDCVTGCQFPD